MVVSVFRLHALPGHLSDDPGDIGRAHESIAKSTAGAKDVQFVFISVIRIAIPPASSGNT